MLERFTGSFKNEKEPEIIYWRMKKKNERERERESSFIRDRQICKRKQWYLEQPPPPKKKKKKINNNNNNNNEWMNE